MRKTQKNKGNVEKILVDTLELKEMLCSGRESAVVIGTNAGARVQRGRRVFWNVKKIQQYIDEISK
jgi:Tfp pilus assembly protein PilP